MRTWEENQKAGANKGKRRAGAGTVAGGAGGADPAGAAGATASGPNKKQKGSQAASTLIVQCPRCKVNVIVPDVNVFQCGACGQYMTIEKKPPPLPQTSAAPPLPGTNATAGKNNNTKSVSSTPAGGEAGKAAAAGKEPSAPASGTAK